MSNEMTLGEVVRLLRVPPWRIVYALTTGKVTEPRRVGGRRLFSSEDVWRLADHLAIEVPQDRPTLLV